MCGRHRRIEVQQPYYLEVFHLDLRHPRESIHRPLGTGNLVCMYIHAHEDFTCRRVGEMMRLFHPGSSGAYLRGAVAPLLDRRIQPRTRLCVVCILHIVARFFGRGHVPPEALEQPFTHRAITSRPLLCNVWSTEITWEGLHIVAVYEICAKREYGEHCRYIQDGSGNI